MTANLRFVAREIRKMDGAESQDGTFFYVLQDAIRILYVDDDPILREFALVHLATETATVETAEDGLAGLEILERGATDLVVLDLEMPRMNGFEVLRRMREDPVHARTPVVVATGREDVKAIDQAFQDGATGFTVKPVNWRLLSYQIRYTHRARQAEISLIEARRRARDEVAEVGRTLQEVCNEGSRFLAHAVEVEPRLRSAAHRYLDALQTASDTARHARKA